MTELRNGSQGLILGVITIMYVSRSWSRSGALMSGLTGGGRLGNAVKRKWGSFRCSSTWEIAKWVTVLPV